MKPDEYKKLLEATELAYKWHSGQRRKQTDIPYVSHPLQVEGLILEHGGSCDQAIAGLLHDSLEDAPDPEERARREERIENRFGRIDSRSSLPAAPALRGPAHPRANHEADPQWPDHRSHRAPGSNLPPEEDD